MRNKFSKNFLAESSVALAESSVRTIADIKKLLGIASSSVSFLEMITDVS